MLTQVCFSAIINSRKEVFIMSGALKKSSTKNDGWRIILFSVIGVAITVASFLVYYKIEHFLIVIGICIIDIIYSYFNAKLFFKSKEWNGARQIFIPLMMIAYWAIFFAIVCIGNAILFEGVFSNQFFLYPIFLMPAFVLEILVLALIASGL